MSRRLTAHNGRVGSGGVYSAKHNDRNFDLENTQHIDAERIILNKYWHCYVSEDETLSFDAAEKKAYDYLFSDHLRRQNNRYIKSGHADRCCNMDEYRKKARSCPEEVLYYLGDKNQDVDPDELMSICLEQIQWEQQTYPNVKFLDLALHMDEGGAPHIHVRKVWVALDKDGDLCVSQRKALESMNVPRPNLDKRNSRYNNPKQTYTKDCREHMLELCRNRGLIIESEAQEASKSGLSLLEYQSQQADEQLQEIVRERVFAELSRDNAEKKAAEAVRQAREASESLKQAEQRLQDLETIVGHVSDLKHIYASLLADLKQGWDSMIKAQMIACNNMPEIRQREIKSFGHRETVYTVSENDARNIQALYGRVNADHIYKVDKIIQYIPKVTNAVNTLYEQTRVLGQVIQQPSQQEIIQRLQRKLSQQTEELDELKQFINDYELEPGLNKWRHEQEQTLDIPEPESEIPAPTTTLDYMDFER